LARTIRFRPLAGFAISSEQLTSSKGKQLTAGWLQKDSTLPPHFGVTCHLFDISLNLILPTHMDAPTVWADGKHLLAPENNGQKFCFSTGYSCESTEKFGPEVTWLCSPVWIFFPINPEFGPFCKH